MTITFQGHVHSMSAVTVGQVELTIRTPMDPTGGKDFYVRIPAKDAQHWLPGRAVSFTIYSLPDPAGVAASGDQTKQPPDAPESRKP